MKTQYLAATILFIACAINWLNCGYTSYSSPIWFTQYTFDPSTNYFFNTVRPGTFSFFFLGTIANLFSSSCKTIFSFWGLIPSFLPFFYFCFLFRFFKSWETRSFGLLLLLTTLSHSVAVSDEGILATICYSSYLISAYASKNKMLKLFLAPIFLIIAALTHESTIFFSLTLLTILIIFPNYFNATNGRRPWRNILTLCFSVALTLFYSLRFSHKIPDLIQGDRFQTITNILFFRSFSTIPFLLLLLFFLTIVLSRSLRIKFLFLILFGIMQILIFFDLFHFNIDHLQSIKYLFILILLVIYFCKKLPRNISATKSSLFSFFLIISYSAILVVMSYAIKDAYKRATEVYDKREAQCEIMTDQVLYQQLQDHYHLIDLYNFSDYYLLYSTRNQVPTQNPKILLPLKKLRDDDKDCSSFLAGKATHLFGYTIGKKAINYYPFLKYFQRNL